MADDEDDRKRSPDDNEDRKSPVRDICSREQQQEDSLEDELQTAANENRDSCDVEVATKTWKNKPQRSTPPEATSTAETAVEETQRLTDNKTEVDGGQSADRETAERQQSRAGAFRMVGDRVVEDEDETGDICDDDYLADHETTPPVLHARPVDVDQISAPRPTSAPAVIAADGPSSVGTATQFESEESSESRGSAPDNSRVSQGNQLPATFDIENVVLDETSRQFETTPIVRASPLREDETKSTTPMFKRQILTFSAIIIAITIGITLGVVLGIQNRLRRGDSKTIVEDFVPTAAPSNGISSGSPTDDDTIGTTKETFVQDVLPYYSQAALEDPQSDQSRALDWLWKNPNATASLPLFRRGQRFAMASFFYAVTNYSEDQIAESGWLSDGHECWWPQNQAQSIICRNDRLLILDLSIEPELAGSIAPEIGLMTDLLMYDFRFTKVRGTIPTTIGLARSLQHFVLEKPKLGGVIPTEVGVISTLTHFMVYFGQLESTIPTQLGLASNLMNINLAGNYLSGQIPSEFGLLSSALSVLALQFNTLLSGTLPTELGSLSLLEAASFSNTSIFGTIPTEFGRLTELRSISISTISNLTGTIPTELQQLSKLEELWLHDTHLIGTFPLCNLVETGELVSYTVPCATVECSCNCNCTLQGGYRWD